MKKKPTRSLGWAGVTGDPFNSPGGGQVRLFGYVIVKVNLVISRTGPVRWPRTARQIFDFLKLYLCRVLGHRGERRLAEVEASRVGHSHVHVFQEDTVLRPAWNRFLPH